MASNATSPVTSRSREASAGVLPERLERIVTFFDALPEVERRENLMAYARRAVKFAPDPSIHYEMAEVRKDAECADEVGLFVHVSPQHGMQVRMTFGPEVQTLTRALGAILCQGLSGSSAAAVRALTPDFIPRIVGAELIRTRARTAYYVFQRVQEACG